MTSSFPGLIFILIAAIGLGIAYPAYALQAYGAAAWIGSIVLLVAAIVSAATKIADQWKRVVVFVCASIPR